LKKREIKRASLIFFGEGAGHVCRILSVSCHTPTVRVLLPKKSKTEGQEREEEESCFYREQAGSYQI
jgi:hypothetical protein